MVLVVGAGPSGLATAYYLHRRNLPYLVLEKTDIGSVWRHHYDNLRLHTMKAVSGLPGWSMPADYPEFPSKDDLVSYLDAYAEHFYLHIETGIDVYCAEYGPRGWRLETNRGRIHGDVLVAATGIWSNPYFPHFAGEGNFQGRIMHASHYKNAEPFRNKRVLVVGGGNSGTEIAVEVAQIAAETGILIRNGVTFVPYPTSAILVKMAAWALRTFPKPWGERFLQAVRKDFSHLGIQRPNKPLMQAYPVVGYELPEAVEAGQVRIYDVGIDRFLPEGIRFLDGQETNLDAVILATGYRPAAKFIAPYLDFDDRGWPILDHGRSTRNPDLYCVGYWYPATEGFLQALGRMAKQVVVQIDPEF